MITQSLATFLKVMAAFPERGNPPRKLLCVSGRKRVGGGPL
jgi:hypothetical protein